MPSHTWKDVERRIAVAFGSKRVVCSGVRGEGDVEHDKLYIEVKHRAKIPFYTVWKETVKRAKKEEKQPIVIIHEKGSQTMLVMLDFDDFIKYYNGQNNNDVAKTVRLNGKVKAFEDEEITSKDDETKEGGDEDEE